MLPAPDALTGQKPLSGQHEMSRYLRVIELGKSTTLRICNRRHPTGHVQGPSITAKVKNVGGTLRAATRGIRFFDHIPFFNVSKNVAPNSSRARSTFSCFPKSSQRALSA